MNAALIIAIPLWVIVTILVVWFFKNLRAERYIVREQEPGVFIQKMTRESDLWVIDHPFTREVSVQIIPDNPDCAGTSLPYVEHLQRVEGRVAIQFARQVNNFTAVIVGVYAERV